jgi:hypothetical protein
MASEIVSTTIDAEFPVAGIDNDTQGFRDNFSVIKQSLASAEAEVTLLQSGTAKRDENNNFAGNDLIDGNLFATTQEYLLKGTTDSGAIDISFSGGHYQKLIVNQTLAVNFNLWPTRTVPNHAKMRVEFEGVTGIDAGPYTLTFAAGAAIILKDENFPVTFNVDVSGAKYVIDVWRNESTGPVYLKYIGTFS